MWWRVSHGGGLVKTKQAGTGEEELNGRGSEDSVSVVVVLTHAAVGGQEGLGRHRAAHVTRAPVEGPHVPGGGLFYMGYIIMISGQGILPCPLLFIRLRKAFVNF